VDWCLALSAIQEFISVAQSELGGADTADRPLPLVSHDIETRCFEQCIGRMKELIEALEEVDKLATSVGVMGLNEPQGNPNRAHRPSPESTTRPVQAEGESSVAPEDRQAPIATIGQQVAATSRYNLRNRSA